MSETAYRQPGPSGSRLVHHYGPNVHILSDVWALSTLARLSHPQTEAPAIHGLIEACYRRLLHAAAEQLEVCSSATPTRMTDEEHVPFEGLVARPDQRVVVVDIARGGMLPSHVFHMELLHFLDARAVRVDHIYMQRVSGADGHVVGVQTAGSKIGGPVDGTTVLIPDPMAATGRSIDDVLDRYGTQLGGPPRRLVACHLIVTPEYLRRITTNHPDVVIYALRLDRGLSSPEVLAAAPGLRWDEERGLNEHDYIVPGAGGLGEIINNAFV